ncbi:hypothetical protein [Corynebacterium sp. AOP40-9SA-29]|uniref:hypothetical protein n=1 Tax=Corynebacterium sp. AOP40-9SA-29 TaxID=3457677 RepID=UPI00403380D4
MSVPVSAQVHLHGAFDGSHLGWVIGGERMASLVLGPGDYRLLRDDRRLLLADLAGTPLLLENEDATVVTLDGSPVDGSESLSVMSPATWLIYPRLLLRTLDSVFPAGPVEDVSVEGRHAFLVPGLPGCHLDSSEKVRWITVDAETGVPMVVDTGDGGGQLLNAEFSPTIPATSFTRDAQLHGTPQRPEPWSPPKFEVTTERPNEASAPVEEQPSPAWHERLPTEHDIRTFQEHCAAPRDEDRKLPGYDFAHDHPDGGHIVLNEQADANRRMLLYQLGRVVNGEIRWAEESYSPESWKVLVVGGRIFTSDGTTLTLRNRDLDVVRRFWAPAGNHWLNAVGPWFGAFSFRLSSLDPEWTEDDDSGTYRLYDPDSLEEVLAVSVSTSQARVWWHAGELWVSDGQLRIFSPPPRHRALAAAT